MAKWKVKVGATARDSEVTFNGESVGLIKKLDISTDAAVNIHTLKLEIYLTDFEIEGGAYVLPINTSEATSEQKE